jgi:hypothetical protein
MMMMMIPRPAKAIRIAPQTHLSHFQQLWVGNHGLTQTPELQLLLDLTRPVLSRGPLASLANRKRVHRRLPHATL